MSNLEILAELEALDKKEALSEQVEKALTGVTATLSDASREIGHINDNGDLSPKGKATQIATVNQSGIDSVNRLINTELESLQQQALEVEEKLYERGIDHDTEEERAMRREIRMFYVKSDRDASIDYQEAMLGSSNDRLMISMEESPFPLVDKLTLEKGRKMRAERVNSETASMLKNIKQWISSLESAKTVALAKLNYQDVSLEKLAGIE